MVHGRRLFVASWPTQSSATGWALKLMNKTTKPTAPGPLAGATGSDAELAEIAVHVNRLLDELMWLHKHRIKLHLKPTKVGWNLKFTVPA